MPAVITDTNSELIDDLPMVARKPNKCDFVLRMASELEPLPATLGRLSALDSSVCDLSDVASAIRLDPVLTLQLLKTANSAFSASGALVSTVDEAVMRLGTGIIVSMAFSLSVGKTMNSAIPAYGLGVGQLWTHSARAAIAAEVLSRIVPNAAPPSTVTAALLHDTGKLLLSRNVETDELIFINRARLEGGLTLEEAEMEVMAMTHPEISYLITRHWGLPERVCRAIMYHPEPDQWDDTMCDAVHLADLAACAMHAEERGEAVTVPVPEVIERMGLTSFDFKKFCAHSAQRFNQLRALYGA